MVCIGLAIIAGMALAYVSMRIRDWSSYATDLSALVVSLIALVISIVTFFSIDRVNSITSMEGNVLENEDYTVATAELVHEYDQCIDEHDFTRQLLNNVSYPDFSGRSVRRKQRHHWKRRACMKTRSVMEFTDLIQNFIDHLIWFAYIDKEPETAERKQAIVNSMKKSLLKYEHLSNGIQYQIEENFKLIDYILLYQDKRRKDDYDYSMENIRGRMLKNPISLILYYDYFGLSRRRHAKAIIDSCLHKESNGKIKEFTAEHMSAIWNCYYSETEVEEIRFYLQDAKKCFLTAMEKANEDVLWKGYISYNVVRTDIQAMLIGKDSSPGTIDRLREELDDTLRARKDVCILYGGDSYLTQQFRKETERAETLREEFEKLVEIVCA